MQVQCPTHHLEMKLVPSGISKKTGRPYKAFYGCPLPDCRETAPATDEVLQGPIKAPEAQIDPKDVVMTKDDWEIKERRAIRKSIMTTCLSAGMSLTDAKKLKGNLKEWEDYVWDGTFPIKQAEEELDEEMVEAFDRDE